MGNPNERDHLEDTGIGEKIIFKRVLKKTGWDDMHWIYLAQYRAMWLALVNMVMSVLGKGKAVPLQAWSGPKGSRKLRFPDFLTTAQDGGKVVSLTHRPPLPPGNTPGTHFC